MKRIDRFGETKSILRASARAEREVLISKLQALEKAGVRGFEKSAETIKTIISDWSKDRTEVLKKINSSELSTQEANVFFLNLKNVVLENLVDETNMDRPGNYGNRFRTKVSNAKRLAQAEILLSKGLLDLAEKALDEVVSRGIKYELFDQAVEAQRHLRFLHASNKGIRTYNRFSKVTEETEQLRDARAAAEDWYVKFELFESRQKAEDTEELLRKSIAGLKEIADKTGIAFAKYLHLLFSVKLFVRTGEYRKAKTSSDQLIKLIKSQPAVLSELRESQAYFDLGLILLQLRKPEDAKEAFLAAQSLIKKSSHQSYLINKANTAISFYQGDIANLEATLPKTIKSKYTLRLPYAVSQFQFYNGLLSFLKGDFKSAIKTFREELESSERHSLDMRMGLNLYLFMAAAEIASTDAALSKEGRELAMKNLNEAYEDADTRKRDRLIIRLVRRTDATDLDYERTATLVKDSLPRLDLPDADLRWEPLTYEVIPFGAWLHSKIKKKKMGLKMPPVPKPVAT